MDLTDFKVKEIAIQKPEMFKAPLGWRLTAKEGSSKDVVSELCPDEPVELFEEVPYAKLTDN